MHPLIRIITVTVIGSVAGYAFGALTYVSAGDAVPVSAAVNAEVIYIDGKVGADEASGFLEGRPAGAVLLVSAADILRCEDLGRQLRSFVRERVNPASDHLRVVVPSAEDADVVTSFLARERVDAGKVQVTPFQTLLGRSVMATPAVVILSDTGTYYGVGYAGAVRGVRTRAFAELLEYPGVGG